jgi:hypothetical protein
VQRGQREDMEGVAGRGISAPQRPLRDPFRSFTCIDPSSKPGVTRPKEVELGQSEGRAG